MPTNLVPTTYFMISAVLVVGKAFSNLSQLANEMSENRGRVVRRLWFMLCGFECCSFFLISAINGLAATIYWKLLNWQDTIFASIEENATTTILLALTLGIFAMFASLIRLLCWRWAGEKENRLRVFTAAAILGNAALVVATFALVFQRTCTFPNICSGEAYHSIMHLQVSLEADPSWS